MSIVSVESLLNKRLHFYVPFYQRGYRWLDEEIKQLLVDMSTWPEQEDHPYFLQLLVVCKNNGKYNIVDGQQRLTTLSLILERIEGESVFDIDYARGYNECSADRRFRDHARNVIDNWLATESLEKKESLKKIILKATFLFHEVPQEEEAAMFQQLNTWRIPATDAELVKCIILSKGESTVLERRTEEWNIIENTLQDNFFWGMLGIKENSQSRMELFLSRYTLNDNSIRNSCHKFPLFDKVQNLSAEEIVLWWNDLLEKWRIFRRYYGNPLYYNYIGWKNNRRKPGQMNLKDSVLSSADLYHENPDYVRDYLLLANAAYSWQNEERYDFYRHTRDNTISIEHIHARNQRKLDKEDLERILQNRINEEQRYEIWNCYNEEKDSVKAEELLAKMLTDKSIPYPENSIDNSIGNLALLTESANSSFNNGTFKEKRNNMISDIIRNNAFYPILTQTVFCCMLPQLKEEGYWTEYNRNVYREFISDTISNYLDAIEQDGRITTKSEVNR